MNKKILYVVVYTEQDSFMLMSIHSTKDKAEIAMKNIRKRWGYGSTWFDIEEFILDKEYYDELL